MQFCQACPSLPKPAGSTFESDPAVYSAPARFSLFDCPSPQADSAPSLASNAWGDASPVLARAGEECRERVNLRSAAASEIQSTDPMPHGAINVWQVDHGIAC